MITMLCYSQLYLGIFTRPQTIPFFRFVMQIEKKCVYHEFNAKAESELGNRVIKHASLL